MMAELTALEACRAALAAIGFEVFVASDPAEARKIFFTQILPNVKADLVSWADSLTMEATGVLDALLADPAINMIKTFDPAAERGEIIERRRQALLANLSNGKRCERISNYLYLPVVASLPS